MTAIAGVAEFPDFIENQLFQTREISEDGKYDIQLYDPSNPKMVSKTTNVNPKMVS